MKMGFCTECGKKLEGDALFCTRCGHEIKNEDSHHKKEGILTKDQKRTSNIKSNSTFKILFLIFLIILIISIIFALQQYSKANALERKNAQLITERDNLQNQINALNLDIQAKKSQIDNQNIEISSLKNEIEQKTRQIEQLQARVNALEGELGITKTQLQETTQKYEEAKPYQERIDRGQRLDLYYEILGDYTDVARPLVLNYLGLSNPTTPSDDTVLWERGGRAYNWLSNNFEYCGDKGLRIGTTFYEFQFWSPDELLMSDNARCGDCDDFATLFAGLMYASGVPESKVWVVCGTADNKGHCWNWLVLSDKTYRIDPVCSQKQSIISILGLDLGIK